jgi:hypothetical protein
VTDRQSIINQEYANALFARDVELERIRPFYLLKPKVFIDGNKWCAMYGENTQEGVCGFGDTPAQASVQFDIEWLNAKPQLGETNDHA